jgi:hypothetical protein
MKPFKALVLASLAASLAACSGGGFTPAASPASAPQAVAPQALAPDAKLAPAPPVDIMIIQGTTGYVTADTYTQNAYDPAATYIIEGSDNGKTWTKMGSVRVNSPTELMGTERIDGWTMYRVRQWKPVATAWKVCKSVING